MYYDHTLIDENYEFEISNTNYITSPEQIDLLKPAEKAKLAANPTDPGVIEEMAEL